MRKQLPVIASRSGCSSGSCATCSTSCSDAGRRGMVILLVALALFAVPLWLLHRQQQARSRPDPPSSSATVAADLRVPSPVGLTALPVAAPAAARPTAPLICSRRSMPHEQRGTCRTCHTVTDCPPAAPGTITAIPTISRTSLLPHTFAGVCGSCHVIRDTPVAAVNRDTLADFPVSDGDRALVMAGQQVVVPTPFHLLQAPVLGRETRLPHAFVGVCSNCHRVVDLGNAPRTPGDALAQGRNRLADLGLGDRQIAYARPAAESSTLRSLHYGFGLVALVLFLLSMVYVVLKRYILTRPRPEQGRLRKQYGLKRWFKVHVWSSIGFAVAVVAHWLCASKGSLLLHLSVVLVVVLTVSGIGMRYHVAQLAFTRKGLRWLHAQRVFTTLLIISMVVGHLLVQMR